MDKVRVAAVGDIHYGRGSVGGLQPLLAQLAEAADVLLLCGDLTDHGMPEEAHEFARELTAAVRIPVVAVLGNHDYESQQQGEVTKILAGSGVRVLDGDTCDIKGVGFAGVKGFAGGFGERILKPWGEQTIKNLVREAVDEQLKLESALARLTTGPRIAVMHYAPIQATVEGEPPEIYPFLGCSRLEEPLNRYPVSAVFHGHAHHGRYEGKTTNGVPVYNVSLTLLRHTFPNRPPFHIETVAVTPSPDGAPREGAKKAARAT